MSHILLMLLVIGVSIFEKSILWGRLGGSVRRPTSAQVMISQFMSLSPVLGSVLTAQSLDPASDSVSISLPFPLPHMLCLCLSHKYEK